MLDGKEIPVEPIPNPSLEHLISLPEYRNSTLVDKFSTQAGIAPVVAFTDLDGTLFAKGKEAVTGEFLKMLKGQNIPLVAVTGRDLESSITGNNPQPEFDVVCAAVGTEIWVRQKDGNYLLDQ